MQISKVMLLEVSPKAQSKPEMYRLLNVEGGMYFPPQDKIYMEFISDIALQVKKISLSNVVDSSIKFNRRLMQVKFQYAQFCLWRDSEQKRWSSLKLKIIEPRIIFQEIMWNIYSIVSGCDIFYFKFIFLLF